MEIPTTKVCSKCSEEKPLTKEFFNTQSKGSFGFKPYCKECQKEAYNRWYEANKEREQAKGRAAYHRSSEYYKEMNTAWRKANPEKRRESNKASRERHKEQRRLDSIEWARKNPEARKAIANAYNGRRRTSEGDFTTEEFNKVVEIQEGLCFYCALPIKNLVSEHVTPLSRGGTSWISNIVASCAPCNAIKCTKTLEEFRPDLVIPFQTRKF